MLKYRNICYRRLTGLIPFLFLLERAHHPKIFFNFSTKSPAYRGASSPFDTTKLKNPTVTNPNVNDGIKHKVVSFKPETNEKGRGRPRTSANEPNLSANEGGVRELDVKVTNFREQPVRGRSSASSR